MPFLPTDLSADLIWLDAQQPVYTERTGASATTEAVANGDLVGTWQARSTGGEYFTAAADAERPTLQTAAIGGLRALRFTGAEALTLESSAFLNDKPGCSVFVVGKINTRAGSSSRIVRINDNGTLPRFAFGDHSSGYILQHLRVDAGATVSQTITSPLDTTPNVWHAHADYANGGRGGLVLTGNATCIGGYSVAGTGNCSATNSARIAIGAIRDTSVVAGLQGDIAELILYPNVIATDDAMQLAEYLADKYSITLDPLTWLI